MNPAFVPAAFHNRPLNQLDRNRRLIDSQHARGLARGRADAAGKLRKVIRRVKPPDCCLPPAVIDQIVPVGNQVIDRASRMAEGNAAVHAAGALLALLFFRKRFVDLKPVLDALVGFAARRLFALNLQKPSDLTHAAPLSKTSPEATE